VIECDVTERGKELRFQNGCHQLPPKIKRKNMQTRAALFSHSIPFSQHAANSALSFCWGGNCVSVAQHSSIPSIHPSIAAASHSRKDLHSFLAKYTKTRSRQGPLTNGLIERSAPPAPNILFCNLLVFLLLISNQLSRNTWAHN